MGFERAGSVRRAWRAVWPIIKEAFSEWSSDKGPRLGAALSYYTVFSIAPVLVVVIAVAGVFLGRDAAQGRIADQLGGMLGPQAAEAVQAAIAKSSSHGGGAV